jgi:hypothetical protein
LPKPLFCRSFEVKHFPQTTRNCPSNHVPASLKPRARFPQTTCPLPSNHVPASPIHEPEVPDPAVETVKQDLQGIPRERRDRPRAGNLQGRRGHNFPQTTSRFSLQRENLIAEKPNSSRAALRENRPVVRPATWSRDGQGACHSGGGESWAGDDTPREGVNQASHRGAFGERGLFRVRRVS